MLTLSNTESMMLSAIDDFSSQDKSDISSSESSFALATSTANKSVESSANSIFLLGFFGRPFSFFSSETKWISLITIPKLYASNSTSSRLIFSLFIIFTNGVGLFPFGSRNSIIPTSKRCWIVP